METDLKKALVLLNMGAPRDLDEVGIFLKNMFNDKNIITIKSNLLRKFISFMIVATRSKEAKESYKELGGFSPLVKHTDNLIKKLSNSFDEYIITHIMRYTPPFAIDELKWLKAKGVSEIVLFPLYAQYSTTTTKSSFEDFYNSCKKIDYNPKVIEIKNFYKNELYNKAIVQRIKESLQNKDASKFDLIFSAHSLPQKIVDSGDPYQKEVLENVDILEKLLKKEGLEFNKIHIAYQSKLGPMKWLEPSLESKLKELLNKNVFIYPISFILDNSESEFELDIEYKELATKLGYESYHVIKCLNDSDLFIEAMRDIINEAIGYHMHKNKKCKT